MTQPFRLRRVRQALAVAVTALALQQGLHAADLRQRLNVRQQASEVVLGETMYQFYLGNGFAAMNELLLAKAMGRVEDSTTESEMLLGDLYTRFDMPEAADSIFSYVIGRDMRSQTRNETLFRKGRLHYRQDNYFEAERILSSPLDTQITDLEAERRVMFANILMSRNEYDKAREVLAPIPKNNELGAYASYNIGVAELRSNHIKEGVTLLEQVMNLPVSDDETNALKDRAALALGYSYLQQQITDNARKVLANVRLEGPFSNPALLALGYTYYERKDYKRALSFWLELLIRNPGDPSVQEAMILAPRAYEALEAEQQAFSGYKLAVSALNAQIARIDALRERIKQPDWLDTLDAAARHNPSTDPMAVNATITLADTNELTLLYPLFAENTFTEAFRQYEQLKRLKLLLGTRRADLQALHDNSAQLSRRQAGLSSQAADIKALQARLSLLADRWPALDKRYRQLIRGNARPQPQGNNVKNMELQFKLGLMEETLDKQPDSASVRALRQRVRTLRNLVIMDIASKAPPSAEQIYADLSGIETQLSLTQLRMQALQQLLQDNQAIAGRNNDAQIRDLENRIVRSEKALNTAIAEYRAYLQALADDQLADIKDRVNNDLAEAHLSIARLQDAAMLRADPSRGTVTP